MKRVSPETRERSKQLRAEATRAGNTLWESFRREALDQWRFRRQVPIRGYIADFVCLKARLIIELDGGQHGESETETYDTVRTAALEAEGFRVIRFWNNQVFENIEGVLDTILIALEAAPPPKSSPRAGEG